MRLVLFSAVFLAALALDQISKFWISAHFVLFESRELVPGFFNMTYVTNRIARLFPYANADGDFLLGSTHPD